MPAINFERLAMLPALKGLTPEELKALFQIATKTEFKVGAHLAKAGDKADCFYLVAAGRFEILLPQEAAPPLAIAQLGFGQLIGEMPLVYSLSTRQADVVAMDDSLALRFAYDAFEVLATQQPELGKKFRSNLGQIVASRVVIAPVTPVAASRPALDELIQTAMLKASIFAGLTMDEREALETIAVPITASQGNVIIEHGSLSDAFYLIVHGSCQVQMPREGGPVPVARLGAGQVIGEMALVYFQRTRTADVVALESTTLVAFAFEDYERLQHDWPGIGRRLKQNLGRVAAGRAWTISGDLSETLRGQSGSS